jgi:carboxyl-terminal processing protease
MSLRRLYWTFAIVLLISLCVTQAPAKYEGLYPEFELFCRVVDEVSNKYVQEVDKKKLFEGAYRGLLSTLDPYSQFIDSKELQEFEIGTKGEFGGLGIEITVENGLLTVITPFVDTPAYNAGILAGDKILKIGEDTTENMKLEDAVKRLRGKPGSQVTITIIHEGADRPQEITLTRAIIEVPSTRSKMVDDAAKIGYLHVTNFQEHTVDKVKEALAKLKAQGMKALVLDLRNNPGGLLSSAIDISDLFLPAGDVVVRTEGRLKSQSVQYKASKKGEYEDLPVAVLINRGSANASEIVAGALHDNGRALLVGETTFGKGSVQSVIPFEEYNAALKLTTARYYTPKGTESIDGKGIKPDLEEKMTLEQQLALLRQRRLDQIEENRKQGGPALPKTEKKSGDNESALRTILDEVQSDDMTVDEALGRIRTLSQNGKLAGEFKKLGEERAVDRQLQRAVDALKVRLLVAGGAKAK